MKKLAIPGLVAATIFTLAACSSSSTAEAPATAASAAASAPADNSTHTLPEIVSTAEGFATLVTALKASGLDQTLNGAGPFTVFAPTDGAFAALPVGVLDALLKPENKDALTKILTYHVLSTAVKAADVTNGDVATVEGQNVTLTSADGAVTVNGANVIQADVVGKNGVAHAIDAVLIPSDVDVNALVKQ